MQALGGAVGRMAPVLRDKQSRVFADPTKIHRIAPERTFYSARYPMAPSLTHTLLFQAGTSNRGQLRRWPCRGGVRQRPFKSAVARRGDIARPCQRRPAAIPMTSCSTAWSPSCVGRTEAEAKAKLVEFRIIDYGGTGSVLRLDRRQACPNT